MAAGRWKRETLTEKWETRNKYVKREEWIHSICSVHVSQPPLLDPKRAHIHVPGLKNNPLFHEFGRQKVPLFLTNRESPVARKPRKAVGPMYIGRVIPEHVKDPRAPVDKSRVLIPGVTGQIPELLRIAVKLHRHHYR